MIFMVVYDLDGLGGLDGPDGLDNVDDVDDVDDDDDDDNDFDADTYLQQGRLSSCIQSLALRSILLAAAQEGPTWNLIMMAMMIIVRMMMRMMTLSTLLADAQEGSTW